MAAESILIIGAIVLACGCAGLLLVRLDNPRLLGLGWLGGALTTGGLGAGLLLLDPRQMPLLSVLLVDLLVLGSVALLHRATREVLGLRGVARLSLLLLGLQAAADLAVIYGGQTGRFRVTVIGLLVAAEAAQTAMLLGRRADQSIHAPARFLRVLLLGFAGWNLLRSLVIGSGMLTDQTLRFRLQSITFVLYLAVGMGLAFGLFWMTTAGLTAKLEDLASTDPLTGVLNRRAFVRYLQEEYHRCQRFSDSFALLLLDIDHFKAVNDAHGHLAGDEVLCATAQNIQDAVRGIDRVGRWGGEEFAILLPRANGAAAHIVAQRIRTNINRAAPLGDQTKHIPITVSLGLAVYDPADSVEEVLCRADAALYRAKSAGRNCVSGWSKVRRPAELQEYATR